MLCEDSDQPVQRLYGLDEADTRDFGVQCLRARRMVERGVRFVQIYSGGRKGGGRRPWQAGCQPD